MLITILSIMALLFFAGVIFFVFLTGEESVTFQPVDEDRLCSKNHMLTRVASFAVESVGPREVPTVDLSKGESLRICSVCGYLPAEEMMLTEEALRDIQEQIVILDKECKRKTIYEELVLIAHEKIPEAKRADFVEGWNAHAEFLHTIEAVIDERLRED